jgi:hypothetical protein
MAIIKVMTRKLRIILNLESNPGDLKIKYRMISDPNYLKKQVWGKTEARGVK